MTNPYACFIQMREKLYIQVLELLLNNLNIGHSQEKHYLVDKS